MKIGIILDWFEIVFPFIRLVVGMQISEVLKKIFASVKKIKGKIDRHNKNRPQSAEVTCSIPVRHNSFQ